MFVTDIETAKPKSAGRKTSALLVALIVHVALAVLFMLIAVIPGLRDEPEIVAEVVAPVEAPQQQTKRQKTVAKQASTASAAAAPSISMMRSNAAAAIVAPDVVRTNNTALGLGEGDFGSGFGIGSGTGAGGGMGSGASFFGAKATGKRFLFVLDHSGSMKPEQVRLRNAELTKVLKSLNASVQFHVLLFAGGAYYAAPGWKREQAGQGAGAPNNKITDSKKETYLFKAVKSYSDYEFDGPDSRLPKAAWLPATAANVKQTLEFVEETPLFPGTDWGLALDIAHAMEPAPEVIYFMADGTGGNAPGPILRTNRSRGKPVINMIAMQTSEGAAQFAEVAKGTKGTFTIVAKDGSPIDGEDYLKRPDKFKSMIGGK